VFLVYDIYTERKLERKMGREAKKSVKPFCTGDETCRENFSTNAVYIAGGNAQVLMCQREFLRPTRHSVISERYIG